MNSRTFGTRKTSVKLEKTKTEKTKTEKTKTEKTKTKKVESLLEHQLIPIKYLVSKCNNQHGLLLNHYMGTGKTLIGTYFAKNYLDTKLIIMLPNGLQTQWCSVAKRIDQKIDKFITYDQLRTNTGNVYDYMLRHSEKIILIVDEAHNLVPILESISAGTFSEGQEEIYIKDQKEKDFQNRNEKDPKKMVGKKERNQLVSFIELFSKFKKVLLLTGTPIIRNVSDIRWLINIAAGKIVVPYNEHEFVKKYYKTDMVKAFFEGWMDNILFLKIFGVSVFPPIMHVSLSYLNNAYFEKQLKEMFTIVFSKILPNVDFFQFRDKSIITMMKELYLNNEKNYRKALFAFFVITVCMKSFTLFYSLLQTEYSSRYNFKSINVNKMFDAGKYISYYNVSNGDPNYPDVTFETIKVSYTDYQLELFVRLINNVNITDAEAVLLNLNKNLSEAQLFKPDSLYTSMYLDKGRIIGNLNEIHCKIVEDCPKNFYRNHNPEKFEKIVEIYQKNPVSTIVYSNFYESGLLLFSKYLTLMKIKHCIYTPDLPISKLEQMRNDFQNKKIGMLLLHPKFYEGFSINGARVFHILEPIDKYYKQDQLINRVRRYHSHIHLPKLERNVKIYQWCCSLKKISSQVKRLKTSIKDWVKNDTAIVYFARQSAFSEYFSADDQVLFAVNQVQNQTEAFSKTMDRVSIDRDTKINTGCCVFSELCKGSQMCVSQSKK